MSQRSGHRVFGASPPSLKLLCLALGFLAGAACPSPTHAQQADHPSMAAMSDGGMAHMAGHMYLTSLRPLKPGDKEKAMTFTEFAIRQMMEPHVRKTIIVQ